MEVPVIKAGVVGASGYTGVELLRILSGHPGIGAEVATAATYAGTRVSELYTSLEGFYDFDFVEYTVDVVASSCEVAFVGLPHGESMGVVEELLDAGLKVVDLSADFRFKSAALYEEIYGLEHKSPLLLDHAVYGLPEVWREEVTGARLVAVPGCYPTAALLGLMPLARSDMIAGTVIIDAKSGVSGAGRKLALASHFPQASDNIAPYGVGSHRHQPEMVERLDMLGLGGKLLFVPHLAPMDRGILATMYVTLDSTVSQDELHAMYVEAYKDETFVKVLPPDSFPETKAVRGSNNCHIAVAAPEGGGPAVVMSVIDNLVKGASGGAVQCMNLMCGLPEATGLVGPGIFP